ncbi:unnamed protein product, partial [Brassica rapa]
GRAGEVLHALGAYFVTTTTPLTPAKKLPAVGGDGGTALDDGAYDGVRKLFVGQAQDGISVVKLFGVMRTRATSWRRFRKVALRNFPLLRFETNKQTSAPFGVEALGHPSNSKRKAPRSSGSTEKSASCYISLEFMSFRAL